MIKISDHSGLASGNILEKIIKNIMIEQDEKRVDFEGVEIVKGSQEQIAKFIVETGMIPVNLPSEEATKVEAYITKLSQPSFDSIDEFMQAFNKRFKINTVCVLDLTNTKRKNSDNSLSVIMIEDINNRRVRIRKYHASKITPDAFAEAGGFNSKTLYSIEEITAESIYHGELFIRHPKDNEKPFIDQLFK